MKRGMLQAQDSSSHGGHDADSSEGGPIDSSDALDADTPDKAGGPPRVFQFIDGMDKHNVAHRLQVRKHVMR
jgi:hypothetical protein